VTFGAQIVAAVGVMLLAASVRSTELYAGRYQTLPMLDWLESRQPLAEADEVPSAVDLARGAARAVPLLVIRNDASTQLPVFGPPSSVQRVVGGVRDAARITFGSPGDYRPDQVPVTVRLDVIVFNRELRAADWTALFGRAMDIRDPDSGLPQARIAGPDEQDAVWVAAPGPDQGGVASVVGHRGVIGFVLQASFLHDYTTDGPHLVDLSARAEALARRAARDWSAWAASQKSV
jgi:hypothetical protein